MRLTHRLIAFLLAVMLLPALASASADAFRPVSRSSSISAHSFEALLSDPAGITTSNRASTTDLGLYDSTVIADSAATKAHQRSVVLANGADVLLEAVASDPWSSLGYKTADSRFELVFNIVTPASYHLVGNMAILDGAPPAYRQPFGQVMLKGPGIDVDFLAREDTPFDYRGNLNTGTYTLSMIAFAKEAWACSATTSGTFTVAPEPASLAALSLSVLLLRRRR
ncbi:MAG: hypothetical protein ACM359_03955 [Bacillota bacterium]